MAVLLPSGPAPIPAKWSRLNELHPDVRNRFHGLFARIEKETGAKIIITSTHRPNDSGYHYFGLAVDFNIVVKGVQYFMDTPKAQWEATRVPAIIRALGFRWGGDFTTPYLHNGVQKPGYDPVHADLALRYPMGPLRTRARALAANKPLSTIDGRNVPLRA